MTLLSIVTDACNAAPIAAPSAIVGNTTDQTALLTLALANEAGNSLTRRAPGGWISMIREYDFFTIAYPSVAGTVSPLGASSLVETTGVAGAGIAPYGWIIGGTGLPNNSVITAINTVGPVTVYTTNLPTTVTTPTAGTFTFSKTDYPLPADFGRTVDNTMWDRTRYWSMRGALSPQEWQMYRSSIFGKATVERRYRFRNSDWLSSSSGTPTTNVFSIDPVPVDNGANLVFEYISTGWCANASTGARQSQWLADTDVGVVDEYLLTLGVKWRLLRRLGLAYNEELDEYEKEVDKAVARDGGTSILNLTPRNAWMLGPYNVQDGNFPAGPVS